MRVLIFITICLFGNNVFADYSWHGAKVTCKKNSIEMQMHSLVNQDPKNMLEVESNETFIFYGSKNEHNFSCEFENHKISGTIKNIPPAERGMCGAHPGSLISLSINEEVYFNEQLFDNDCVESLTKLEIYEGKGKIELLKVCGTSGMGSFVSIDGCITVSDKMVAELSIPIDPRPFSSLVQNTMFKQKGKAGFDCQQAKSPVENLICSNSSLSQLDGMLSKLYSATVKANPDEKCIKDEQIDWLKKSRNSCRTVVCLKEAYYKRINQIEHSSCIKSVAN